VEQEAGPKPEQKTDTEGAGRIGGPDDLHPMEFCDTLYIDQPEKESK
jgi:hypothetical protein